MNEKRAAELISENLTAIYGYSFARLYDKDDVDDLSSEIVCEILKSAGRLKDEESFWAFAWKIAENTFRKFVKRKELAAREEELSETTDVILQHRRRRRNMSRTRRRAKAYIFSAGSSLFSQRYTGRSALPITFITDPAPRFQKNRRSVSKWSNIICSKQENY